MKRIKAALIVESALGGVARYISDLVRNLDRDELDVDLYYSPVRADPIFGRFLDWSRSERMQVFEIPMQRSVQPLSDLKCGLELLHTLRRGTYQIIHCHSSKAGALGRLSAAIAGSSSSIVYTPHGLSTNVSPVYWGPEWLLSGRTDVLIAVSESERLQIRQAGLVRRARLICIPPGVTPPVPISPRERTALRQELGCGNDQVLVVTVGRLCREKDPALFYSIARAAGTTTDRLRFAWVGDGDSTYSEEVPGVSNVGFRADVGAILQAADIFLLTSLYESFGYATAEAMAAGLPVVATNVMGTRDLVQDGLTGFLFGRTQIGLAVDALSALANNRERRLDMGARGAAAIRTGYSLSAMANDHQELYRELASPMKIASAAH